MFLLSTHHHTSPLSIYASTHPSIHEGLFENPLKGSPWSQCWLCLPIPGANPDPRLPRLSWVQSSLGKEQCDRWWNMHPRNRICISYVYTFGELLLFYRSYHRFFQVGDKILVHLARCCLVVCVELLFLLVESTFSPITETLTLCQVWSCDHTAEDPFIAPREK